MPITITQNDLIKIRNQWTGSIDKGDFSGFRPDIVLACVNTLSKEETYSQSGFLNLLTDIAKNKPDTSEWDFLKKYIFNALFSFAIDSLVQTNILEWCYEKADKDQKQIIIKNLTDIDPNNRWNTMHSERIRSMFFLADRWVKEKNHEAVSLIFSEFIQGSFGTKFTEFKSTMHFSEMVEFMRETLPFREEHQDLYDEMVSLTIMGYVGYNKDSGYIPALMHAGVPVDLKDQLKKLLTHRDTDVWDVLHEMARYDLDRPDDEKNKNWRNGDTIAWAKDWANAERGQEVCQVLFSVQVKKRNKNPSADALSYMVKLLGLAKKHDFEYINKTEGINNTLLRNFLTMYPTHTDLAVQSLRNVIQLLPETDPESVKDFIERAMRFIPDLSSFDIKAFINAFEPFDDDKQKTSVMLKQIINNLEKETVSQDFYRLFESVEDLMKNNGDRQEIQRFLGHLPKLMISGLENRSKSALRLFMDLGAAEETLILLVENHWTSQKHKEELDDLCLMALCNDDLFDFGVDTDVMTTCKTLQKALGNPDFSQKFMSNFKEDALYPPLYTYMRTVAPEYGASMYQVVMSLFDGESISKGDMDLGIMLSAFRDNRDHHSKSPQTKGEGQEIVYHECEADFF